MSENNIKKDEGAQAAQTENKLGTESVLKLILTMSPPAMLSMFITSMYNIVDSYFVAKISDDALAAVSLAFPVQMLMSAFCIGTGVGVASVISRRLGQKRQTDADNAATHGLILALISAVVFAIFGFFGTDPFVRMFTTDSLLIELTDTYLSIVCIFSFGIFLQICCERILQSTGNMMAPMIVHIIGAVVNIIMDPILIFGYFGFPAMGIAGAAVATVFGQILAMIIIMIVLFRGEHRVKISFKGFRFHGSTVKDIYAVGFPNIIMQSIGSLLSMIMNRVLSDFGTAAYTVYGLYFKLQSFVFMPVFGMNQGLMPIVGYNYGARKKKRLLTALRYALIFDVVFSLIGMSLFLFIPDKLLGIFTSSADILEIGVPALKILALVFTPAAISIVISTIFQSMGRGFYSLINSLLRQLILILPLVLIFSQIGVHMVWWAFPIAEVGSVTLTLILFIRLYNKEIKHLETVKLR